MTLQNNETEELWSDVRESLLSIINVEDIVDRIIEVHGKDPKRKMLEFSFPCDLLEIDISMLQNDIKNNLGNVLQLEIYYEGTTTKGRITCKKNISNELVLHVGILLGYRLKTLGK